MAKIGRNDPCPCGSGKKYKQCHGPIDAARATEQRQLKQAQDTLLAKLMEATPRFAGELADGLQRFWNGRHTVEAIEDLDDLEERGSERFLTWFVFNHRGAGDLTPLERLAQAPDDLELTPAETTLLPTWTDVHFQPYAITAVQRGLGLTVRPLWEERELVVEDHAAARRVEEGEVLIAHLTPAGDMHYVAGAAAHLTADTVDRLHEWADLHLEDLRRTQSNPSYADLIRNRSEIFNHFVMALPREEQGPNQLQMLIDNARVLMATTAASLGFGQQADGDAEEAASRRILVPQSNTATGSAEEELEETDSILPDETRDETGL
jgi:hypothetical protein